MATKMLTHLPVLVLLCFGVIYGCLGAQPKFTLYRGRNFDDASIEVTADVPDLATINFDDQVHSYRLHGTAVLYEYRNYNAANSGAKYIPLHYTFQGNQQNVSSSDLDITSSIRYLTCYTSANNSHTPCVKLFEKNNFGGLRIESITASKPVLDSTDYMSLVNIGNSAWTFYDEINYRGTADCVEAGSVGHVTQFLEDSTALKFSLNGKRSVEEGCWAQHGVPLAE